MKKPIVQICFSLKSNLTLDEIRTKMKTLKTKLDKLYGTNNYETRSCHLSRQLCLNKGFTTDIPDLFDEVFGENYVCELSPETDFSTAMAKINDYRIELSKKADKLVILAGETVTNVALELELFTQNRIMIL